MCFPKVARKMLRNDITTFWLKEPRQIVKQNQANEVEKEVNPNTMENVTPDDCTKSRLLFFHWIYRNKNKNHKKDFQNFVNSIRNR